jgi:hypothetical protein
MTSVKRMAGAAALGAAMLTVYGLSALPVQAGYVVTLEQLGSNVVATGSGAIDLTGLTFLGSSGVASFMTPAIGLIHTGPIIATAASAYSGLTGPTSFGSGGETVASTGSGDVVGIEGAPSEEVPAGFLVVPEFYTSGASLSDTSTFDNQSFTILGVIPGTYEWTWGSGANQNFTLQIGPAAVPAPSIGRGLPALLAISGAWLLHLVVLRLRREPVKTA